MYKLKVQRGEENDSRYIQENSAPVTVSFYEVCSTSQIFIYVTVQGTPVGTEHAGRA